MSSVINRDVSHSGATNTVVPMNRWGPPNYSFQLESGTWTVEGTIDQINRGDTPTWFTLSGVLQSTGTLTPIAAVAVAGIYSIDDAPVEAIRATSTGAGESRIMQIGLTDWA